VVEGLGLPHVALQDGLRWPNLFGHSAAAVCVRVVWYGWLAAWLREGRQIKGTLLWVRSHELIDANGACCAWCCGCECDEAGWHVM